MPKKKLVRGPLKSKDPGYKIPYPPTPKNPPTIFGAAIPSPGNR